MTMKALVHLVCPMIMIGAVSCGKVDPEDALPAATQFGAATGGCLIDNYPFVATGVKASLLSNAIPALAGGFYHDSLYYLVLRGQTDKGLAHIYLFLRSNKAGTYSLNEPTFFGGGPQRSFNGALCSFDEPPYESYSTGARHTGQVTLTYASKALGISAGTFAFTAVSGLDSTKTITVTSGRFDNKE